MNSRATAHLTVLYVTPTQEGVDSFLIFASLSFPRRRESCSLRSLGIPAFAGMTANTCSSTPAKAGIQWHQGLRDPCRSLALQAVGRGRDDSKWR
jgi:hypothetical protein